MGNRCYKGRFTDNTAAKQGMRRCIGGTVCDGILWRPCRYLPLCLDVMSLKVWKKRQQNGKKD